MNFKEREQLILELKSIALEMNKELDGVIVEGKKDSDALRALGYTRKIIYPSLEGLESVEVVSILTDFDSEGKKIYKRVLTRLNGFVKVNQHFRIKIYRLLTAYGARNIEAISGILDSL
jgi:5S rRNA maturation endonuclease (ribonuclease M5)